MVRSAGRKMTFHQEKFRRPKNRVERRLNTGKSDAPRLEFHASDGHVREERPFVGAAIEAAFHVCLPKRVFQALPGMPRLAVKPNHPHRPLRRPPINMRETHLVARRALTKNADSRFSQIGNSPLVGRTQEEYGGMKVLLRHPSNGNLLMLVGKPHERFARRFWYPDCEKESPLSAHRLPHAAIIL